MEGATLEAYKYMKARNPKLFTPLNESIWESSIVLIVVLKTLTSGLDV